jgi:hypothetical protein
MVDWDGYSDEQDERLTDVISPDQAVTHRRAWSQQFDSQPIYDYPPTTSTPSVSVEQPWWTRAGLKVAGAGLAVVAGALAIAIIQPGWHEPPWGHTARAVIATVTQTNTLVLPAPATVTQTALPDTVTQPPAAAAADDDDLYVRLFLQETGFGSIRDPAAWIRTGHDQCAYIAAGHSAQQTGMRLRHQQPLLTLAQALSIVDVSIKAYCPQLGYANG